MSTYSSTILRMIKETHDTYSLQFDKPKGFDFTPGMYCLFDAEINAEVVKRSYSLSSSPEEDFLQITVKQMPHGKMSGCLTQLSPGDKLHYIGPIGKFLLGNEKEMVFIAGGSGISPFRAMLRHLFYKKKKTDVKMIYGCRSPRDIALNYELHQFLQHKNFKLFITVDHGENWPFHIGFIDADFINEATDNKPIGKTYYIVGPPVMVESVKKQLHNLGVKDDDIRLDVWG